MTTKPWEDVKDLCCGGVERTDWITRDRVHCWKNHIPTEAREIWDTLTLREKQIFAWIAKQQADNEEWD